MLEMQCMEMETKSRAVSFLPRKDFVCGQTLGTEAAAHTDFEECKHFNGK